MTEPVVLLVPPAGGDSTTWGQFAEILGGSFRVLAYDRREGTLEEQAAYAGEIIVGAGGGSAVVAGVSAGATIALRLAVDRPELVRALHVHEPPFHGKRHPNLSAIRAMIATQRLEKTGKTVEAAEEFAQWAYRRADGVSVYDQWPEAWRDTLRANASAVLSDIRFATGESIRRRELASVAVPVCCSAGALSPTPMRRLVHTLARWLPNGTFVDVPAASHSAIFEQPTRMAMLISQLAAESMAVAP